MKYLLIIGLSVCIGNYKDEEQCRAAAAHVKTNNWTSCVPYRSSGVATFPDPVYCGATHR